MEVLYIPSNIKTRLEFFEGYGTFELIITLISAVISSLIAIIIYNRTENTTLAVLFALIMVALTITVIIKDRNNQSIMGFILNFFKFLFSQKKYIYGYKEEWL